MIAAVYARKSTDQSGVTDEARSVTRQIEHAKTYAARKGWQVDDAHVYVDDGISGAEFANRPGFLRLMNSLTPRPPFQVLIMSEESRLGREAIETAYALKQIIQAGCKVFFYLEDRERTLESPTDKLLMSVTAFADELEREKARQRTYDAMHRKALAGHVTGGRVFGYDNVEVTVTGLDGRKQRSHVERRINEKEATIVRRIFELCAAGYGVKRIASALNEERLPCPRSQQGRPTGWASSSVRSVLFRPLYRGELVWNQTQKRDRWGRHRVKDRPESQWLRKDAPAARIVSEALWNAAHARLDAARQTYLAGTQGQRWGRPATGTLSKHLLTGIARCGCCGGGLTVRSRNHGKHRHFRYACSTMHYRGRAVCENNLELAVTVADGAVLDMLAEDVLQPDLVDRALEKVWQSLNRPDETSARKKAMTSELAQLEREIANLTKALTLGGDIESVVAALKVRESRKRDLKVRLDSLRETPQKALSRAQLFDDLRGQLTDWRSLCASHVPETRRVLETVLNGRIVFTPTQADGQPAYEMRAPLTFERMFSGLFRSHGVASPTGFEPVFRP